MTPTATKNGDVFIATLVKGAERWIVKWNAGDLAPALRAIIRWAMDKEVPFTWNDAVTLSKSIQKLELQ